MNNIKILGLNSAGFNTSSALIIDGKPIFAVEEERLIREKRTRKFPIQGISEALKQANTKIEGLDAIAIAWNPAINLEALNQAQSHRARYLGEIFYNVPNYLMSLKKNNSCLQSQQIIEFLDGTKLNIHYVMHHISHASSFFFSPFEKAAIMTIDAFGEKQSTLFAKGEDKNLEIIWSQDFPHSLGSFYSTITEFLGFQPQNDEWKLMGASSYGDKNRYYDKLKSIVNLKEQGFEFDLSYFNYYQFHRPLRYTKKLIDLLELEPNESEKALTQEYYDLAAAAQAVTEDIYFHLLNQLHSMTKQDNLVLSGGVAFNSVANGKIFQKTPFKNAFIPPTPDDSGGSLGAAFYIYHKIMNQPREYVMTSNYLGPGYSNEQIKEALTKYKIKHTALEDPCKMAAKLISSGKIIGWFQGRLEFGDRALGNRSILADPRDKSMKDKVNETVKYREPFRPFAPSILQENLDEFFINAMPTPFMEKIFYIHPEKQKIIPAVTHVDGTGRLQSVSKEQNSLYYNLIKEFYNITGVPVILNTSFNLKGEPIVCSPNDAIRTFFSSGLDALIIGNYLIDK